MKPSRLVLLVLAAAGGASAAPMKVQVQTTPLRAKPAFLSPVVVSLSYDQTVEAFGKQGAWSQVRTPSGQVGWVHESALAPKKIQWVPGAAAGTTGASSDEMALAGKGFSDQVEKQYRAGNTQMDYTWVDKMASNRVDMAEVAKFVAEGGLKPADGSLP